MEEQVFVARERELAELDAFLKQAMDGQGLACFVTGEAGSGKTTLVTEFARRAQEQYAELAVAVGQSDAQTGTGDAHLPFREVLGQLTGDVGAKLAEGAITEENASRLRELLVLSGQALVEVGPDLIGVFVPGAGLATRMGAFVAEKVGWLDKLERLVGKRQESPGPADSGVEQSHIFEQYANVLGRLSDKHPLLLVLDDLQWADTASIGLLFRLGRRIGGHRILLIGTYRPEEVAIGRAGGRHPLEKVLAEFKRYYGDIQVDLDRAEQEGRQFVDALLNSEPNQLQEGFRLKLFRHTGGHALFTIELLRTMQERGDLVRDEHGRWVETPALNWESLPKRVEGVIEERIGRLAHDLRQMLTVGSVEGEDFTAEVVARVQAQAVRGLVRCLSAELERQHRLVSAQGVRRLDPAGQRLSLYQFQHNLFQRYLYNELDEVERSYLHEDVGNALEELYGDRVDEIVVQLARHFDEAGIDEKARLYLERAGRQAAVRFANDEAIAHFSRALELTPESEPGERYARLLAREQIFGLQGERELQAQDMAALQELAQVLGDDGKGAELALRRADYAMATSDYPAAVAAAEQAISLAEAAQDTRGQAMGYFRWGSALRRQGDYEMACSQFEQALALSRAVGLRQVEARSLRGLGLVAGDQSDLDKARAYSEESLRISRELGDRRGESTTLCNLGGVSAKQGDNASARGYYEKALAIARETGDRQLEGMLLGNLGTDAEVRGDFGAATERFRQVGAIFRDMGDRRSEALAWAHLGFNAGLQGAYDKGRAYCDQALEMNREIGNRQGEVYVRGILSWLLWKVGSLGQATTHAQEALHLAQALGGRGYEATIWGVLGRIHKSRGELEQATAAYQRGLDIFREMGADNHVVEDWAGLAGVALAQGNPSQAGELVEKILSYAQQQPLQVANDNPLEVYLVCYQVLRALEDERAGDVLRTAHRLLQEQASRISDQAMRRSFLENVSAHCRLVQEFEKTGSSVSLNR